LRKQQNQLQLMPTRRSTQNHVPDTARVRSCRGLTSYLCLRFTNTLNFLLLSCSALSRDLVFLSSFGLKHRWHHQFLFFVQQQSQWWKSWWVHYLLSPK